MRKLAFLALGLVSLGLVGCGSSASDQPDEATLRKKLSSPPDMSAAGQHKPARKMGADGTTPAAGGG